MLAKVFHTLVLSLQGSWGLPGEFSELGIAVIFTWLMPHVGQGIKDLIAKVPLTSHEQHKLAKTQHTADYHCTAWGITTPIWAKWSAGLMTQFRAIQIAVPIRHSSLWGLVVFTVTSAGLIFVHALIFVQQGRQYCIDLSNAFLLKGMLLRLFRIINSSDRVSTLLEWQILCKKQNC